MDKGGTYCPERGKSVYVCNALPQKASIKTCGNWLVPIIEFNVKFVWKSKNDRVK